MILKTLREVLALFAGEKQVQQERFGNKLSQTKDAAHSVIDAKLAAKKMEEILELIA